MTGFKFPKSCCLDLILNPKFGCTYLVIHTKTKMEVNENNLILNFFLTSAKMIAIVFAIYS